MSVTTGTYVNDEKVKALAALLKVAGDVASAIRMNSFYVGRDYYSLEYGAYDVMVMSHLLHNLTDLGNAVLDDDGQKLHSAAHFYRFEIGKTKKNPLEGPYSLHGHPCQPLDTYERHGLSVRNIEEAFSNFEKAFGI